MSTQEEIQTESILQAAFTLYHKHGLKKVTMDDVAKAIGKSRSAIYYYYKNREEIVVAVMDRLIRNVMQEIGAAIDRAADIRGQIHAFCLFKIKTSEEKKAFFTAIEAGMDADEISRHTQLIGDVHKRMMAAEAALLKVVLSAGIKAGTIRALKPKEQDTLIFVLQSSVRGIRRELSLDSGAARPAAPVDMLTDMTLAWLQER